MRSIRIHPALLLLLAGGALAAALATASALRAAPADAAGASAARQCSYETHCADVSVSGHAEPQPIRKGGRTTLKVTAKNNGPGRSWNSKVATQLPKGLKYKGVSISGDGGDYGCSENGYGYVECLPGELSPEELAVVKIKVTGKRRGTWVTQVDIHNNGGGWYDPNGGNNQVRITACVGRC